MSLADKVRVNTHYTRSINLIRDAESLSVIESYIPTSRALRTFGGIRESLKVGGISNGIRLIFGVQFGVYYISCSSGLLNRPDTMPLVNLPFLDNSETIFL